MAKRTAEQAEGQAPASETTKAESNETEPMTPPESVGDKDAEIAALYARAEKAEGELAAALATLASTEAARAGLAAELTAVNESLAKLEADLEKLAKAANAGKDPDGSRRLRFVKGCQFQLALGDLTTEAKVRARGWNPDGMVRVGIAVWVD